MPEGKIKTFKLKSIHKKTGNVNLWCNKTNKQTVNKTTGLKSCFCYTFVERLLQINPRTKTIAFHVWQNSSNLSVSYLTCLPQSINNDLNYN